MSTTVEYRAVNFVSPTRLTVPTAAADIANAGAYQMFVEDFPPGSNGCAVFGYQPFVVAQ